MDWINEAAFESESILCSDTISGASKICVAEPMFASKRVARCVRCCTAALHVAMKVSSCFLRVVARTLAVS